MTSYLLGAIVILLCGLFVMFNRKFLKVIGFTLGKTEGFFYKYIGRHVKRINTNMERTSTIRNKGLIHRINLSYKEIIVNLDMVKHGVTVAGLLTFILSLSFFISILLGLLIGRFALFMVYVAVVFYSVTIVFKFFALVRFETKEAHIMDTEDLIAMDIKGGVHNAIIRYHKSFHPSIQPYFEDFLDDIENKGESFRSAMTILNDKLGASFTDFAQKAIQYEERGDNEMADIFSATIEINRHKRDIRYSNNIKFNALRMEFVISLFIIILYGVFSIFTDAFIQHFFLDSVFGLIFILADIVLVTFILAFIASIKAKLM